MNKDLAEVITTYATEPHTKLATLLLGKSKDQLINRHIKRPYNGLYK